MNKKSQASRDQKGRFIKGNKINFGRRRLDLIGNKFGKQFQKGHKVTYKNGISLYRKRVKRKNCTICNKKVRQNTNNLLRKSQEKR